MNQILLFNKPHGVLTRFTDDGGRPNLSHFIEVPGVYPVGRLDADSEGLLLLTDRASLVDPLLRPGGKSKRYLVCVEGNPETPALEKLRTGVELKDGRTLPAEVREVAQPDWLWERDPPIRFRKTIPTSWLELEIREGRNRQVRRMTAAVGLPTLRLVRVSFGPLELGELPLGQWRRATPEECGALLALERRRRAPPSRGRRKPGSRGLL